MFNNKNIKILLACFIAGFILYAIITVNNYWNKIDEFGSKKGVVYNLNYYFYYGKYNNVEQYSDIPSLRKIVDYNKEIINDCLKYKESASWSLIQDRHVSNINPFNESLTNQIIILDQKGYDDNIWVKFALIKNGIIDKKSIYYLPKRKLYILTS